jgi:uncharacterized membrane protein YccC
MMTAAIADWVSRHRPQLRLSLRITLAGLAAFAIGHLLGLPQTYWAVLTAVIVTQASIGGSLKASIDRFVGSLGGAAWGVAISLSAPHQSLFTLGLTLAAALGPLAVVTALNPAYRVAPVTAIIILLTPASQTAGPVLSAVNRLLEVGLGSLVALAVAMLVLPERAHGLVAQAAARALAAMSQLIGAQMAGLTQSRDAARLDSLNDQIRKAIAAAEIAADEASRERRLNPAGPADPGPLCRTLRRLHHDLTMVGRASAEPLPEPARSALAGPAAVTTAAMAQFFGDSGEALTGAAPPPALARLEQALAQCGAAVGELRASGATRALPDEAVGRVFGLTFAFGQLRSDIADLADRTREFAGAPPVERPHDLG